METVKVNFALGWKDYYYANKLWLKNTRYLKYIRLFVMLTIIGCGAFIIWVNIHGLTCSYEDYSLGVWLKWLWDSSYMGILLILAGYILFSGWFNKFAY